ncbi:hypothetical protein BTW28_08260 [Citrobacter freundii]|nr:hypothetical protein BTW28_08260 [Citrobacter freundii]ATX01082.1 hypothetical protein CU079_05280 [Citrobacter freundii]
MCWLLSFTPVTYSSKLLRIHSIAAVLELELFRGKRWRYGMSKLDPCVARLSSTSWARCASCSANV